jgi:hypothetical protein
LIAVGKGSWKYEPITGDQSVMSLSDGVSFNFLLVADVCSCGVVEGVYVLPKIWEAMVVLKCLRLLSQFGKFRGLEME